MERWTLLAVSTGLISAAAAAGRVARLGPTISAGGRRRNRPAAWGRPTCVTTDVLGVPTRG